MLRLIIAVLVAQIAVISIVAQEPIVQFDQPVDAGKYIIRPGDELTVTFLKANVEPLELEVDPEGRVIHENLGLFNLSHRTLSQAREILSVALKSLYKVEHIIISITKPRPVRISVTGAVESPGFYEAYTSQRVSEAVKLAGDILEDGSTRRIVFSGGPEQILVDLDLADYTGDISMNPSLYAGYSIHVPRKSSRRVQVIGEVNHPREIELIEGDDLRQLIHLAGGTRSWADTNNVQLIRNGKVLDADVEEIKSGDVIKVPSLSVPDGLYQLVAFGAVKSPGRYPYSQGVTLGEFISHAGGFEKRAVKPRTTVFRLVPSDSRGRISHIRYPIGSVYLSDDGDAFALAPGDSVFVPYYVGYVKVSGYVLNPGYFPFTSGKNGTFYVSLAGGYLPEAERSKIDVFDQVTRTTTSLAPGVMMHDGAEIVVNMRMELE